MILNQTNTGLPCPKDVKELTDAVLGGPLEDSLTLMRYVKVHAFTLALVLDRLEALETFEREVISFRERFPRAKK